MASFTLERSVAAPPEEVFGVLTDHRAYPDFTPIRKAVLEKEGKPSADGVGAVRSLSVVGPPMREEVLEYEAPTRFVYKLLSGLPTKDHIGIVSLAPEGDGTRITYEVDTHPKLGPLNPVFVAVIKRSIASLMGGVASEAQKRASAAAQA